MTADQPMSRQERGIVPLAEQFGYRPDAPDPTEVLIADLRAQVAAAAEREKAMGDRIAAAIRNIMPDGYTTHEEQGYVRGIEAALRVIAALASPDTECGEPVALYDVPYGEQYDPCVLPKGHSGGHSPVIAASSEPSPSPETAPALDVLLGELSVVGDEHADLCGRAYIAIRKLAARLSAAEPSAAERGP